MEELKLNLDSNSLLGDSNGKVHSQATLMANLIKQTEEYQELLRLGKLINLDPEVNHLIQAIRIKEQSYSEDDATSVEDLRCQLEALPAFINYMKAENNARELFQSIDQVISENAGVDYAANAKRSSCGCGG